MSAVGFLQDLAVVLLLASAVLVLFQRLGQPPVLGYLAAGLIIGPHMPPRLLVRDPGSLQALADVGVVFLLFVLGLEFNLRRLARVGLRPLVAALIEVSLMAAASYAACRWAGWSPQDALLFGCTVCLASTAIVARHLMDPALRGHPWVELVAGRLVAEDLVAILLLAFLSSLGPGGEGALDGILPLLGRMAMVLTLVVVGGLLLLPRLVGLVDRLGPDEVRSLAVVGICFGMALLTEKLGLSAPLGAFLAGSMMSLAGSRTQFHGLVAPFKDVFGAVFFVSVGMLIDPRWLLEHWAMALVLVLAVGAARLAANFLSFSAVGEGRPQAVQAALAGLPIGEFSFLLAAAAESRGLTDRPLAALAVAVCLGTTLASSVLLPRAAADPEAVRRLFPGWLARLLDRTFAGLARPPSFPRLSQVWGLAQPSLVQIALNVAGISGLFLAADWAHTRFELHRLPGAAWLAASFFSLPFLIAVSRKTWAVVLILIEAVHAARGGQASPQLVRLVPKLATALVAVWFLSLSLSLLPPWPMALAPLAVVGVCAYAFFTGMTRLYARLQAALRETLSESEAEPEAAAAALSHMLSAGVPENLKVVSCALKPGCLAAGRTIGELRLRTKTGASILQVGRGDMAWSGPGPDLTLEAGDELLVIGEAGQLDEAGRVLGLARGADPG